jgi:NAD(P)-dependent dehydrogenase (short-subunit alcohol dehydrogenase family)
MHNTIRFPDMFDLTGKHALVTGGANGLGRMIAEGLLRAGASVTITSRKEADCRAAAVELSTIGTCTGFVADLSSPDAARDLGRLVREHHDGLDILINNSGRTWAAPIETFPDKGWTSVMAINVQAPFRLVQEFLPELEAAARGSSPSRVINIGSIAGKVTEPLQAYSYAASKAAVHHLTRQLAADLAERSITVNTVIPGYFPTSMTAHLRDDSGAPSGMLDGHIPLRRFGTASDIAGAIVFLCSSAGAYVTGAELVIDGGITGCR